MDAASPKMPPAALLALSRHQVEEIKPIPLASQLDEIKPIAMIATDDQNAVSTSTAEIKRHTGPELEQQVSFEQQLLSSARDAAAGAVANCHDAGEREWEQYGTRDTLVVPGVDEQKLKQELQQLLKQPDAPAKLERMMQTLKQTLEEAKGQGYMVDSARMQDKDLSWLLKAVDPKVAGSYDYLKGVQTLLQPLADKLARPDDTKAAEKAILRLRKDDPFDLLPTLQEAGHFTQADQQIFELQVHTVGMGDNHYDSRSALSHALSRNLDAFSGFTIPEDPNMANYGPQVEALDRGRARLMAAVSQGRQDDLTKLTGLFGDRLRKGEAISADDQALLKKFGFDYDPASQQLSTKDRQGQSHTLDSTALNMLSDDCYTFSHATSAGEVAYVESIKHVMEQTGILQEATAELERLMHEAANKRVEQQQTQQELTQVTDFKQRAGQGNFRPEDAALLQGIDPKLSLSQGNDGRLHVTKEGREVSGSELDSLIEGRRQALETKNNSLKHEIAALDEKILTQGKVVAEASQGLQLALANADKAFKALPPESQAKFAKVHQNLMGRAQRALNSAQNFIKAFQQYFGKFRPDLLPQARQAIKAADPHEKDKAVAKADKDAQASLAPAPTGPANESATVAAEAQQAETAARSERSEQRVEQARSEVRAQAMTGFLDRLQHLRHELLHDTDAHSRELLEERARNEARRAQSD